MWFVITFIILGLIAGAVARVVVPHTGGMGIVATIVTGIVGSFVGGLLGYLLFGKDLGEGALQPSGIVGSIIGAIIVLFAWNAYSRGGSRSVRR